MALALCKIGFVSGFGVPRNVLKIAWGSVGKVYGVSSCCAVSMSYPEIGRPFFGDSIMFLVLAVSRLGLVPSHGHGATILFS